MIGTLSRRDGVLMASSLCPENDGLESFESVSGKTVTARHLEMRERDSSTYDDQCRFRAGISYVAR